MVMSVARIAASKLPHSFDVDDLFQIGVIGLMQAADRWDAERGTPFNIYAVRRVRGAMYDHVRGAEWNDQDHEPLFYESEDGRTSDENAHLPAVPSFETDVHERMDRSKRMEPVLAAIAQLQPVEQHVLKQHYLEDATLISMTDTLQVSKCRVSQIHTRALQTVREDLLAA